MSFAHSHTYGDFESAIQGLITRFFHTAFVFECTCCRALLTSAASNAFVIRISGVCPGPCWLPAFFSSYAAGFLYLSSPPSSSLSFLSLYLSLTHTNAQTLSLKHTHTHARMHAHTYTHVLTHTHTHTFAFVWGRSVHSGNRHDVGHHVWIYEHVHSVAGSVRLTLQYTDKNTNNITTHHQYTQ